MLVAGERLRVGSHRWMVRFRLGQPSAWVAADFRVEVGTDPATGRSARRGDPRATLLQLAGGQDTTLAQTPGAARPPRRVSAEYAIAVWGTVWGRALAASRCVVQVGAGRSQSLLSFHELLARVGARTGGLGVQLMPSEAALEGWLSGRTPGC